MKFGRVYSRQQKALVTITNVSKGMMAMVFFFLNCLDVLLFKVRDAIDLAVGLDGDPLVTLYYVI